MQVGLIPQKTITSTQHHSMQQVNVAQSNTISGLLVVLFPVVVVCAIVTYRKQRARTLRQRIQRLNRLWQLDSSKNLS